MRQRATAQIQTPEPLCMGNRTEWYCKINGAFFLLGPCQTGFNSSFVTLYKKKTFGGCSSGGRACPRSILEQDTEPQIASDEQWAPCTAASAISVWMCV